MRTLVSIAALCAMTIPAIASQNDQNDQGMQHAQTAKQLKATLENANHAEAPSHPVPAPTPVPGQGGGTSYTYCESAPNSQGNTAIISFGGSLQLHDDTFNLQCAGAIVHPASFGMFTYGPNQTNVPFGNGTLCISPFNPGIYRMPVQALTTPTMVLAMEDAPGNFALINPGSSWNFQFWYRDPNAGGSKFNLSNGLHIDFAPAP
jgi:hypothetical protein